MQSVSTHAPARGATKLPSKRQRRQWFQLTRPRGARLASAMGDAVDRTFQLTRPRGARPADKLKGYDLYAFQLTRPRGARLHLFAFFCVHPSVSTHAPARGATGLSLQCAEGCRVSTHAPARGATARQLPHRLLRPSFNSRAREGRDQPIGNPATPLPWVSTHAPARGATCPLRHSSPPP